MYTSHILKQFVVFTYLILILSIGSILSPVRAEEQKPFLGPTPSPERMTLKPPEPVKKEIKYYPVNMEEVYISTDYYDFHQGLDFASNQTVSNPKIYSIEDGIVVYASDSRFFTSPYGWGYGKLIVIEHEKGVSSLYAHLETIEVKEGDTVKQGDFIGLMGSTGNSTGIHLHFEMFTKGEENTLVKHNPFEFNGLKKVFAVLADNTIAAR